MTSPSTRVFTTSVCRAVTVPRLDRYRLMSPLRTFVVTTGMGRCALAAAPSFDD